MNEQQVEQYIKEHGLTAPRVTPAMIDAAIAKKEFSRVGEKITFCELTLVNGFRVGGVNMGPVDMANFKEELAQQLAYEDARRKIWELEGYLLASKRHDEFLKSLAGINEVVPMPTTATWDAYLPHQQRVLEEQHQLSDRTEKLLAFFSTDMFAVVPEEEQVLMKAQYIHMANYRNVLRKRIAAFVAA